MKELSVVSPATNFFFPLEGFGWRHSFFTIVFSNCSFISHHLLQHIMGVSKNRVVKPPKMDGFLRENAIRIDDLGAPYFRKSHMLKYMIS